MTIVSLLILLLILAIVGLAAWYIINKFFVEEGTRKIAFTVVGIILLIVLLSQIFPGLGEYRILH